jgi:hypothetical protein
LDLFNISKNNCVILIALHIIKYARQIQTEGKLESMAKKDFQKKVRQDGGYILSDGTLNEEHLLAKAYDFIKGWNVKSEIPSHIIEVYKFDEDYQPQKGDDISMRELVYWGRAELKDDTKSMDSISWLWNETIFKFFNEISPNGYIFGSSEGDGACIGWFKYDEEEF